ncbi:MAG: rRNA maturation RNase YbeY [Gammaproteobacteria bacterium]|nr:rRNA maturation RNase YbeY [Gammaproteobacteria bacterium]
MSVAVDVQLAVDDDGLPSREQIDGWAKAAWRDPVHDAEVVVRITDEAESRHLNREFRGRDAPTNVLSFPYEAVPEIELRHIGDLVLCAPVVLREADAQGKRRDAHWAHMVVHGMLHLQGYDHVDESDAATMEALETAILAGLGYPAPYDDETP